MTRQSAVFFRELIYFPRSPDGRDLRDNVFPWHLSSFTRDAKHAAPEWMNLVSLGDNPGT